MKKLVSMVLLSALTSSALFGMERSYSDAKNVALNLANKLQSKVGFEIDDSMMSKSLGVSALGNVTSKKAYHIIKLKPKGWVIVSNDDIAKPILGYNLNKKFDEKNLAPQFINWANGIDKEIKLQRSKRTQSSRAYKSRWDTLSQEPAVYRDNRLYTRSGAISAEKLPLMPNIQWGQGSPFNKYTPNNNVVGCSATAMSQIMAYHKWPTRGAGSYSYTHGVYGNLSVNFDNLYNWYNMGDLDYALISYHVGVSMDMEYHASGSGAWPKVDNMRKHFSYEMTETLAKSKFTDIEWDSKIKNSLANNRPIWYSGYKGDGGHAFVLDGYRYDATSKVYHVNFGWNGMSDGWYTLSGLNGFSGGNHAIFDIRPNYQAHFGNTKVSIINPTTKRNLFSPGSIVSKPENGWINSPIAIGTDANYYGRSIWELIPYGDAYRIRNVVTHRYLFLSAAKTDFTEYGWSSKTPKIIATDADYYSLGQWRLVRMGQYNNDFKIQHIKSGRFLFQSGDNVNGKEYGWSKSPSIIGLGSHSNYYNRATWNLTFQ